MTGATWAFVWENFNLFQLDIDDCTARGINDAGHVVGSYPNGFDQYSHATLWIGSTSILSHKFWV